MKLSLSFGCASLLLLQNHLYFLVGVGSGFAGCFPESCLLEMGNEMPEQHLCDHGAVLHPVLTPLPSPCTTMTFRFCIRTWSFLSLSSRISIAARWACCLIPLSSSLSPSSSPSQQSRRQYELPVMALVWMKVALWQGRWFRSQWQGQPHPKGPQRDLILLPGDEKMWWM